MARILVRTLTALVLLRAVAASAAPTCEQARDRTGLAVGVRDAQITVVAVDPGSAAERAGFRTDDVVLQVNDVVPRSCSQWGGAVNHARGDAKALLVLVLRAGAEVPLALGAGTWTPPAEAAAEPREAGAPGPRAAAPGAPPRVTPTTQPVRPATPPPPPPLPADVAVSVEGTLADLGRLAPADQPPEDLARYREAVGQVRREIETLAARGTASADDVAALRHAVRYYEAAEIAWEAIEGDREREHRSRRMPIAEGATVPYFGDSPAATIIDEFGFLDATVAREPVGRSFGIESSGLWRPVWARILLWERGARELEGLRQRLGTAR